MRRLVLLARAGEILVWGSSAKGTVRPVVIVEVSEGIDVLVEAIEVMGEVVTGIEFVAP